MKCYSIQYMYKQLLPQFLVVETLKGSVYRIVVENSFLYFLVFDVSFIFMYRVVFDR
jgi:hypothetical protein